MSKLTILIVAIVILVAGTSGCLPSSQPPTELAPAIRPHENSPFGFHPAYVVGSGYEYASDIGIHWDRPALYIFWFKVQDDPNRKEYNWSDYDRLYTQLPADMHIMANIGTVPMGLLLGRRPGAPSPPLNEREREKAKQYVQENSYLPRDEEGYLAFVRACVERFDGDGIDDMKGLKNPIKHWQVENEPPRGLRDYAGFLKITYQAIKDADPEAGVIIGGVPGMPPVSSYLNNFNRFYFPILQELAESETKYFDIFDIHWYGNATGDYRELRKVYTYIRQKIDALGLSPPKGYWITEMGTYSGKPIEERFLFQGERQQAQDVVKRYVYPLSLGIRKVFLAFGLMEGFHHTNGYFDHTGLIYDGRDRDDPGRGIRKLSYYTYKLMVEKLEGSDWDNIETVRESNNVYIYQFTKKNTGEPIWVAWWDYFNDTESSKTITLRIGNISLARITEAVSDAESGKELKENDYPEFFKTEVKNVSNGAVSITLGESPVFVEPKKKEGINKDKGKSSIISPISLLKKIDIGTGARPEVVATDNRVFVIYLGNIKRAESRTFSVKIFNSDFTQEIVTKDLVYSSSEYGDPTDIRVTSDGNYLYAFYETASMKTSQTYLWGAKYTLDDSFERVAFTGLIASGKTFDIAEEGDEKLDDPIALLGENSVFAITRYKSSLEKYGETRYKVYEFTKDLLKVREFDLNLSSIADGGARQASAIYHNGYFYMVVPTTVGPAGPIGIATPSDIVMVKLDTNWNVKESTIISADPDDIETYVTGFKADSNYFYLTYNQRIGTEFSAPLKIYDQNFNLIINEKVRVRKPEEPGLRPSLEIIGDRIFVGHSSGKRGEGNAEIYVYEIVWKETIEDKK